MAAMLSYRQCKLMKEQSDIMAKQLDGDRYLRQNEHSVELARLFADEIVPQSGYVTSVVRCSKSMRKVADKISHSNISRFDADEYRGIVGESPSDTLKKIRTELLSDESIDMLLAARTRLSLTKPSEAFPIRAMIGTKKTDRKEEAGDSESPNTEDTNEVGGSKNRRTSPRTIDAQIAYLEFDHVSHTLLNRLEHFCMALNSEIADDEVLYPSLHQIFFSIVSSLYIFICDANSGNPVDKYFTHVTDLYNKWMKRYADEKDLFKEIETEIHSKYEQKKNGQLR